MRFLTKDVSQISRAGDMRLTFSQIMLDCCVLLDSPQVAWLNESLMEEYHVRRTGN